jgi:hypothetical protein
MKSRLTITSLITAAILAACSSPTVLNLEDVGAQPTLEELNADNESSLELAGSTGGLGNLLMRKIYDTNQNGKRDEEEPSIPDWGVRIVSVDANGNPDDAADIQVTPQGSQRWRGVNLKVPYGRYKIEELEPTGTKQAGVAWKVTGKPSRTVNVSRSNPLRAIEFAGVCLENGAVVKFPKLENFYDWKCHATFDLLPRISSFTATPDQIQTGGSSVLKWNVLDYSKLEITPGVGAVTGFTGSKNVTPASTTAYTLKATNGFGSRTANVTVNVGSSKAWQTPAFLTNTAIPDGGPTLVRGSNDQALFVAPAASITEPGRFDIFASFYALGNGWGSFERLGGVGRNNAPPYVGARIATNGDAFAYVANSDQIVTVFRKANGGSWSGATNLDFGFQALQFPGPVFATLETDASGNAFVLAKACLQPNGRFGCNEYAARVTRFTPQTGWSAPVSIPPTGAGDSLLAVHSNGDAVIANAPFPTATTTGEVSFSTFTPSTGWSGPKSIATVLVNTTLTLHNLSIEASGKASLVWHQGTFLCHSSFTSQTVDAKQCVDMTAETSSISAKSNASGLILVLYNVTPSGFPTVVPSKVFATEYVPGSGWTQPKVVFTGTQDGSDVLNDPSASVSAVNDNGEGVAGLYVVDSIANASVNFRSFSSQYNPQTGWQPLEKVWGSQSVNGFVPSTLGLVKFSNGSELAVGEQFDGSKRTLFFNTYR